MNPIHLLAHLCGMAMGRLYFFTDEKGIRMVGHRCSTCGLISHSQPSGTVLTPDEVQARRRFQVLAGGAAPREDSDGR